MNLAAETAERAAEAAARAAEGAARAAEDILRAAEGAARAAEAAVRAASAGVQPAEADEVVAPAARIKSNLEVIRSAVASDRAVAKTLGVSESQVRRWWCGQQPDEENADRLAGLAYVVEMLLRWLEPDIIEEWLTSANAHLNDMTPAYHIRQGQLGEVVGALEAMKNGVFV